MQAKSINERAMLVRMSISIWTARKYDKKVSQKAASEFKAKESAGRYNKHLGESQTLTSIVKLSSKMRGEFYSMTLPWLDDGSRIVPSKMFPQLSARVRTFKEEFANLVEKFKQEYPQYVENARTFLGDMFNFQDYPPVQTILSKFDVDVFVYPLPDKDDFRVEMLNGQVESIKNDIAERVNRQLEAATNELWNRLYEGVSHMSERLSDSENVFRDSMVENLKELVTMMPKLNVMGDTELNAITERVATKLTEVSPRMLRESDAIRESVAREAEELVKLIEQHRN